MTNTWMLISALMVASNLGDMSLAKSFPTRSAQVGLQKDDDNSALMHASQAGHREVVQRLLKEGTRVNLQDGAG